MARFFFNVVKASGVVRDIEGIELPSLDHARHEAIEDARCLMSIAMLEGRDVADQRMEIVDEAGTVLQVLPFREAIEGKG